MLAMVDMRGNFIAIGLVLLVGGVVLRFARSKKESHVRMCLKRWVLEWPTCVGHFMISSPIQSSRSKFHGRSLLFASIRYQSYLA